MNRKVTVASVFLTIAVSTSQADTCPVAEVQQQASAPSGACAVIGRVLSANPTVGVFDAEGKFKCELTETPQGPNAATLRPSELPARAAEVVDCNLVLGIVLIKVTSPTPFLFWAERNDVRSAGDQRPIACNTTASTQRDDLKTPTAAGSGESCKKANDK